MRVNFFLLLEQSLAEQSKLYPQSYPQFPLLNFVILETFHWLGNFIEPGFHYYLLYLYLNLIVIIISLKKSVDKLNFIL